MIVRSIINRMKLGYMLDDDSLSRLSGIAVDYMVTGSLAAISLVFVGRYWLPLLTVSTLGGLTVLFTVPWMCSRVFRDHRYERMIMLYGVSTGTLSTGLALLRILDPEFKSKVSNDYMLSAGMTFGLAIPFILAINLPAQAGMQGTLGPFWTMVLISVGYLVYSLVSYAIVAKSRAFRKPSTMWLEEDR
jgi:ESS family glutamate:Na+ symporter